MPFNPKPQPVYSEEERITYEEVPKGTLMRVFRVIDITDGVEKVRIENKEILWDKSKEDIYADIDKQKTALNNQAIEDVAKLTSIQAELTK